MSYARGYKIYEPLDPMNPNLLLDNLVKTLTEGVDYLTNDASVSFEETLVNSAYLNGGYTEYRYFVPFDDENTGIPSSVFSLLNLMPPTNISITPIEFDELRLSFTSADFAQEYKYSIKNLSTNVIIEGILPENGSITGLEANTLYEVKLSSLNQNSESTEWGNTIQGTTFKLFLLETNVSDNEIVFQWEHSDTNNVVVKFDLINTDNNQVIYSGLSSSYDLVSPTAIHNNLVKVTYDNGSTRNTRTVTSYVYNDSKVESLFSQETTKDYKNNVSLGWSLYRDFIVNNTYKTTFFTDYLSNFGLKNPLFNNKTALGSYLLALYNYRDDKYGFTQGSLYDGKFNSYIKTQIYQLLVKQSPIKFTVNNNLFDAYMLKNNLYTNKIDKLPFKPVVSTAWTGIVNNKFTIIRDDKFAVAPKFYIGNSRKTQYGLKMEYFNFMKTLVTRGRQRIHNPSVPFEIDNIDVIINATITNVDIQSQVNKVRILCVGDSITAGAPSYDPQYGGTVFMVDLITGKTKTRNVIESEYPYWLQTRLGIGDFEVINEGSGRRTSTEVEYHIDAQMELYKPEYVIIMIGTNDIFSAQDSGVANLGNVVNTTINNIRKTVDKVRELGGIPILGTQLPRNSIVPIEAKNALRNLNTGIKNLGIEYAIDIIDWYDEFVQKDSTGKENGVLRYDLTVDDTHPSVLGYKKMAYTINLGIFNSFRASLKLFGDMLGNDVDYSKEESKVQPDPYTLQYQIGFPELRRLQRYVFSKYIKNTGNSWGLFTIQLNDLEDICEIWDAKNQVWTDYLVGQLAPNQIMELRMRYIIPATGTNKEVDFNIDYIVKR